MLFEAGDRARVSIAETDLARARRWCEGRVPLRFRDQVRVELKVHGQALTVVERRPPWPPRVGAEWSRAPVARFFYDAAARRWTLFWPDRNSHWRRYQRCPPSSRLDVLLVEVDHDPTGIFWG